jgi:hypothetical protein
MEGLGKHMAYYWIGARYFKCSSGRAWSQHVWHGWKPILLYRKQSSRSDDYQCPWFRDVVEEGGPEQAKVLHDYGQAIEDALYFIRVFTRPGDIILDTFCGSGTTLVAAKKLERRAIGFEINSNTASIAKARLAHEASNSVDLNEDELAEYDPALAATLEGILHPFITNTISNIFRGWDGEAVETSRQLESPLIERRSISEWELA